ncbi:MAG: GNAT family N-acetyltransferase [Terriglobia bacterium]
MNGPSALAVEIVDIRHFDASDFAPLLDAESSAWRSTLRWDYAAAARLIATCLAEKRLSGYALVSGRRIRGYCFFIYEGEKGLIGSLFVEPICTEYAPLLLEHVIETLKATPGLHRVEAQLPHYSFEALDTCFRRHQFQGYFRRFMARPLGNGQIAPSASVSARSRTEFTIEPWLRKHDDGAARLLYRAYNDHVDAQINDQYCSVAGASRLLDNIVHLRGCGESIPQASSVALHRLTGKLAGFLALTAVQPGTAHIPQVAVANEFQGQGIGGMLMESSFKELERLQFEEVSLTVTELNAGAVHFYERLGFETFHSFGAFVWNHYPDE